MKIVYYNEYKRDAKKAEGMINKIKSCEEHLPYDYYIEAEVRMHICPARRIKELTGFDCCGLTYPRGDGSYDVYVSFRLNEALRTALHELMHVVIDESLDSGLFATEALGERLMKEWNKDYDCAWAKENWREYLCCAFERYVFRRGWREAHPKTTKFFEMRGFKIEKD